MGLVQSKNDATTNIQRRRLPLQHGNKKRAGINFQRKAAFLSQNQVRRDNVTFYQFSCLGEDIAIEM
jgi:hypothetical protein